MYNKDTEFLKGVENLYMTLYMSGGIGLSGVMPTDPGLKRANSLYEENYPDKYSEARKLQREIDSKKAQLQSLLSDDEDCDEDY